MEIDRNTLLNVQVLGLSMDYLNEVSHALEGEPGMMVSLLQGGVETLQQTESSGVADVVILRKTTKSEDFYRILTDFIHQHPGVSVVLSAPYKDPDMMVKSLRAGVKEFLFEPFLNGEIAAIVKRLGGKIQHDQPVEQARVLVFIPCKGGSGATFLASNLAHILAEGLGQRVLLVDLNLQFGDAYLYLMDHPPKNTLGQVCGSFLRFDYQFLESATVKLDSGVRLLAAPDNPADAELVKPEHVESILRVARAHFDYVILDVGRTLDTVTLKALDLAEEIYPVLQLTLPSVRDAQRMKAVFDSLDYSEVKTRWVINRSGGQGGLDEGDAARLIGKMFWDVPNDHKHVEESVNQGVPVTELYPHSSVAKSLKGLSERLVPPEKRNKPKKGWFGFG